MDALRRGLTRVALEACYHYSRLPFARGYGRFGKWIARSTRCGDPPYVVRRRGALWELHLEEQRYFADRGLILYGRYESETTAIIDRLVARGSICVDVGANMGFYTVTMARVAGWVYSFEPANSLYRRLLRHINLNRLANVTAEQLALSDHRGEGKIYVTQDTASINPQHWSAHNASSVDSFHCITFDEYCEARGIDRIDFMKVDIDGHEPAFLRGAMNTLARLRPTMIIEIVPECLEGGRNTAVQICRTLIGLGYCLSGGQSVPCDSAEDFVGRFPAGTNALCQAQ